MALSQKESSDHVSSVTTKTSSWFRRSLVARESAPAVPQHIPSATPVAAQPTPHAVSARPPPVHANTSENVTMDKTRANANKRATWTNGLPANAAPIPILPSIRPISPLSDAVTAQGNTKQVEQQDSIPKVARQLSIPSSNHYADVHRQEAERALIGGVAGSSGGGGGGGAGGGSGMASPTNGQKESFFSHLRKRARRFSGRYQTPMSPNSDDIEANVGCSPWATGSQRQSMLLDGHNGHVSNTVSGSDFAELDRALQSVRTTLEASQNGSNVHGSQRASGNPMLKRHHSLNNGKDGRTVEQSAPISSRTRRAVHKQAPPNQR
ncbi:hypothetical protein LTS18_001467, partial [Coniosporium uncinatum]